MDKAAACVAMVKRKANKAGSVVNITYRKDRPQFLTTQIQPKLDAIEQIRGDLNAENIEVPGIVVAGAQSSGKSSLLESLSDITLPAVKI